VEPPQAEICTGPTPAEIHVEKDDWRAPIWELTRSLVRGEHVQDKALVKKVV